MGVNNCLQCGRPVGNCQGFTDGVMGHVFCSQGCQRTYKNANSGLETVVGGLIGKAIGGAVSGAKARMQDQADQEASEQEQRRVAQEERDRQFAEEKAAASAARHVITHEVVCPVCDAGVSASMASDGETKVRCKQCKTRLKVHHDGDVTVLGPKDAPLSKAESLDIIEDRICDCCKYYLSSGERTKKYWIRWPVVFGGLYVIGCAFGWGKIWAIGGAVLLALVFIGMIIYRFVLESGFKAYCKNAAARDITGNYSFETPADINRNLRCKFWEKK